MWLNVFFFLRITVRSDNISNAACVYSIELAAMTRSSVMVIVRPDDEGKWWGTRLCCCVNRLLMKVGYHHLLQT